MFAKSLESSRFRIIKVALFKISSPDSQRVKILNLDQGRYCRAKFLFFQFFPEYLERRFEKFRFLHAGTADLSDSDGGCQILSYFFSELKLSILYKSYSKPIPRNLTSLNGESGKVVFFEKKIDF